MHFTFTFIPRHNERNILQLSDYCFIYRLVIVSKSTASKDRRVSEVEGGCRDLIEELSPWFPGGTEKNHKNISQYRTKLNSVALVRERTITTERPPPVGEVSANFWDGGVSRDQRNGSPRPLISVFWTGATTFYSSSSSIDLTRLSGTRSRPTTTQKIW